jgi:hypothetical protein
MGIEASVQDLVNAIKMAIAIPHLRAVPILALPYADALQIPAELPPTAAVTHLHHHADPNHPPLSAALLPATMDHPVDQAVVLVGAATSSQSPNA